MENNFLKNTDVLKYIFIGLGVFIILIAVLIFSGKFPGLENKSVTNSSRSITIYGIIPEEIFNKAVDNYNIYKGAQLKFDYYYVPKEKMRDSIILWASQNKMPDLVIADADTITSYQTYFQMIPYSQTTELEYQNIFIDGATVYTTPYGFYFYPLSVDPLITFYNKKILRESGMSSSMTFWSDGPKYQKILTMIDSGDNILRSAFAFAGDNVINNKSVMFAMLSQASGRIVSPIITLGAEGAVLDYNINLGEDVYGGVSEFYKILFYQDAFVDPQRTTYTWNVSDKIYDRDRFIDGSLAMYFGKASEYSYIKQLNPSLDIGLNYLPQASKNVITSGDMYGIAITSQTKDLSYAYEVSKLLSSYDFSESLASPMIMSSARKDTLAGSGGTLFEEILGKSALVSEFVFSNKIKQLDSYVSDLYNNISSGRENILDAIDIFSQKFYGLYNNN